MLKFKGATRSSERLTSPKGGARSSPGRLVGPAWELVLDNGGQFPKRPQSRLFGRPSEEFRMSSKQGPTRFNACTGSSNYRLPPCDSLARYSAVPSQVNVYFTTLVAAKSELGHRETLLYLYREGSPAMNFDAQRNFTTFRIKCKSWPGMYI